MKRKNQMEGYEKLQWIIIFVVYASLIVGSALAYPLIPAGFIYGVFAGQVLVYATDWVINWLEKKGKALKTEGE